MNQQTETNHKKRLSRRSRITLYLIAGVVALMLLSILIVPWQLKKQGKAWIAAHTERTLEIEKISFNPLTLTLKIGNLKLSEPASDQTFLTFEQLILSADARSLLKRAVILDRVELIKPFVNIEFLGKQKFNFSDFILTDVAAPETAEKKNSPLHFALNNIIISNGSIDFSDRFSKQKSRHEIRELALQIPFFGNLPYLTDQHVEPQLELLLNNSRVRLNGRTKPFHASVETVLNLTLEQVDLAYYAFHSPVPLPFELTRGTLDCNLDLDYRISPSEEPKLYLGGDIELSDLDLREQNDRPLLQLSNMAIKLDWVDLLKQNINLKSLEMINPQLHLDRDSSGHWNLQRISAATEEPEKPDSPIAQKQQKPATKLPLIKIAEMSLRNGRVFFQDDFVKDGFSEEIKAIELATTDFSTHPGQKTTVGLSLQTDRDMTLTISGDLGLVPATANLTITAKQLLLEPFYPYLEPYLTAPVAGDLNVSGQLEFTEQGNLLLQNGRIQLTELAVPFPPQDQFKLASLMVTDAGFDLNNKIITVAEVALENGDLSLSRTADGAFSPLNLLRPTPGASATATNVDSAVETEPGPIWNLSTSVFDLKNFAVKFADLSQTRQPRLDIPQLDIHAEQLSYPQAHSSPFQITLAMENNGSVNLDGTIVHTPLDLTAELNVSAMSLAQFNDFIPEQFNLKLKSGEFFASTKISLQQQKDRLSGSFSGQADISRFNLRDPLGQGTLLSWETLNLDRIEGDIAPFALHIREVALGNYQAHIQVTPDGQVNLSGITNQENQQETTATEKPPPASSSEVPEPPPDIRIDALTLQGGTVSFIDRSLPNLFSATMYELGGRVTGMASDEQMQADVDLRGRLENHSPLTISGKINPLSRDFYADLNIDFKDIDLTPMSPYSGTYLGYLIDKGKLYLDLNYRIEKRKINADNKILIDQFTLGETVKSDKAVALPLGLAVALLKDANGEINLDVPVYGDLDDPNFSVVGVVFTIIRNLIVKAATAPFSLLASMMGGGDDDFSCVVFNFGQATLADEDRQKLPRLAEMLVKRPGLSLEISAFIDPELDPESYRRAQLQQKLMEIRRLRSTTPPVSAVESPISAEEYPELVLTLYRQADFPRPRTPIGTLKELPLEEMEKLLLANILAGEEEMQLLAQERAREVRDVLVGTDETIKPRIFLKAVNIHQAPEKGSAARVEFSIQAK